MANASAVEAQKSMVPWWLVLIEGIAAIIIGILLFLRPAATTIILIQFLGIYWLITGIFSIISLIWDRSAWGWKLFSGILGILAGILIIQNPLWSTLLVPVTLALVLGGIGIVIGILQLVDAFRGGGWGVGILGGISILLGILLIARPVIAGLTLPWVLGGLLIFGGILAIVAAFGLRSVEHELKESRSQAARVSAAAPIPVTGSTVAQAPTVETNEPAPGAMGTSGSAAGAAVAGAAGLAAAVMPAVEDSGESISQTPGGIPEGATETVIGAGVAMQELAGEVHEPASSSIDESVQAAESLGAGISEAALTGNVTPADPEEMAKFSYLLEYVEGIGPVYAERLKLIGLTSCLDLLKVGASRKGREEIAINSGISATLILKWINHIDLYRIKGVGSEYADLLEASGVDTVVEMAQRNPTNLYEKMTAVNAEKALVRKPPTADQVEDWVSQAKGLPRIITY